MQGVKRLIKKILPKQMLAGILPLYHRLRAMTANLVYGYPARKLTVIGITGTNGKTTTAVMLGQIIAEAGYKVGVLSTAVTRIKDDIQDSHFKLTTEDAFTLQKNLRRMVKAGVTHLVLEVSSHSLIQHRIWGIRFKGAIFTNLTQDHLDYHGSMENYAAAKRQLFVKAKKFIILNKDDKYCHFMKVKEKRCITYGVQKIADVTANRMVAQDDGWQFETTLQNGDKLKATLHLRGAFNVSNALAASIAATEMGISSHTIKDALESIRVIPGRMERITAGQDFTVLIDHAHTPDALSNVLKVVRQQTKGRIITVVGADGERDTSKRGPIGQIVAQLSDYVIVTDQEPYADDPGPIRQQVIAGIKGSGKKNFTEMADRRQAIGLAYEMAQRGDTVLITGLGNQQYRGMASGKVEWDERAVAKEILKSSRRA